MLKIGDEVIWRGCFGSDIPKRAKVTGIHYDFTNEWYGKSGDAVLELDWKRVQNDRACVVDLSNGHWAYGNQLEPMHEGAFSVSLMCA